MKTVMGTRAFLFATLLGVYSGTVSAGLINFGTMSYANGDVSILDSNGSVRVSHASKNDIVYMGETVITSTGAHAWIDYSDNSQIKMGENSNIIMDEFVSSDDYLVLRLLNGLVEWVTPPTPTAATPTVNVGALATVRHRTITRNTSSTPTGTWLEMTTHDAAGRYYGKDDLGHAVDDNNAIILRDNSSIAAYPVANWATAFDTTTYPNLFNGNTFKDVSTMNISAFFAAASSIDLSQYLTEGHSVSPVMLATSNQWVRTNSGSVSSPTVAPTYNPNLYVPEPPLMVLMGGGLLVWGVRRKFNV